MGELAAAAKIAFGLAGNGLRYRCLRLAGRPGRPQAVSLEVTHRCVCRCVMCNIWKIPTSVPDLSLEQWNGLLSSPLLADLRELDITGGEPFLRDDLVSLVGEVCRLKAGHLGRLRSIAITTNGVLCDRVVDTVEDMLAPMERAGLDLVVVCALDAVGESHDLIRSRPRHKGFQPVKCGDRDRRKGSSAMVITEVLARNAALYGDEICLVGVNPEAQTRSARSPGASTSSWRPIPSTSPAGR